MVCSACKKDPKPDSGPEEKERELIDAPPLQGEVPTDETPRCVRRAADAGFSLGNSTGAHSLEFSSPVAWKTGFAMGVVRFEPEQHAAIALLDGSGGGRTIDLWPLHGPVPPPAVAVSGQRLITVVVGSDASHWTLRFAAVDAEGTSANVQRGPEVLRPRNGDLEFSLATAGSNALLVWDDYRQASGHFELKALAVETSTLAAQGSERLTSPPGEDSSHPRLVSRPGGYYLVWVSYPRLEGGTTSNGSESESESESAALVDAPPGHLRVALLDESGDRIGDPLTLTKEPRRSLVYDAALGATGDLVLAYRDVSLAAAAVPSPVHLIWLAPDGATRSATAEHDALGEGTPTLSRVGSEQVVWLGVDGRGASYLLGELPSAGQAEAFRPEPGLFDRALLGAGRDALLTVQFRGERAELATVDCTNAEAEKARTDGP